jgi:hypothetical protein
MRYRKKKSSMRRREGSYSELKTRLGRNTNSSGRTAYRKV